MKKILALLLLATMIVTACAAPTAPAASTTAPAAGASEGSAGQAQAEQAAQPAEAGADTIIIDGSSTVAPITSAVAEEFQRENPNVRVPVGISGTGGGFKKFCAGETDISDASRPIKESEFQECSANGIEYIELPVAFDGMAVLVNPANDWVECFTVEELKKVWEPAAEGVITNWSQIREGFPDRPLNLYGAGVDSGTYDYFTQAIVGEEGASRGDFLPSEDDNVLVQGIAGDENALGFFGLAYYEQNMDKLKLVAVDNNNGTCVLPDIKTVADGSYQPLSRPIFIYVNRARIDEKPILNAFVDFYMKNAGALSAEVGYVPLTEEIYTLAQKRYDDRVIGSIYAGGGSQVGVSLADLLAAE